MGQHFSHPAEDGRFRKDQREGEQRCREDPSRGPSGSFAVAVTRSTDNPGAYGLDIV